MLTPPRFSAPACYTSTVNNKNNNSGSLAPDLDDDPTAELEALANTHVGGTRSGARPESDEHTSSFEEPDEVDAIPVARLRSDLRRRNESIGKLQYDIEQLRSRWTSLEKEIRAREQQTERLNGELRDVRGQLEEHERQQAGHDQLVAGLRSQLADRDAEIGRAAQALAAARDEADAATARIAALETQQSSDAAAHQLLEDDLRQLRQQVAAGANDTPPPSPDMEQRLQQAQLAVADLTRYIEGRRASWERQQAELEDKDRLLAERAQRIDELAAEHAAGLPGGLDSAAAQAHDILTINVQETHRNAEIRELKAQIKRTEQYADSLRRQLQDAREESEQRGVRAEQLQHALDNALDQVRELRVQLEDERLTKVDVVQERDAIQRRYDSEIAQLQNDLKTAQEEMAEQHDSHERLAAELRESYTSAESTREKLREAERDLQVNRTDLQRQTARQQQDLEDLAQKLESKDDAIAALLNELSTRRTTEISLDDIGHVVSDLDDRMQASFDERDAAGRYRGTRLLVGTIEGQKLRFPLFKERLTVGRSADNDIQLKTRCISRLHAVIESSASTCRILDQNSKNGIYINGRRRRDAVLNHGDRLVLGTATLIFEERSRR